MKKFLVLIAMLLFTGVAMAHDSYMDPRFSSGFEAGYARGYEHGIRDRQSGVNYEFRHSSEYNLGSGSFRSGYERGYSDGYHRGYARNQRYYNYGRRGSYNTPYGVPYNNQRGAVTAFEDENFRGRFINLEVGSYPYLVGGWDDRIESLVLNQGVRVILFDERNFRGRRVVLEGDSRDLDNYGFEKKAASMIVEPIGRSRNRYDYDRDDYDRYEYDRYDRDDYDRN